MNSYAALLKSTQRSPTEKSGFGDDVITGLCGEKKSLPAKYFYDAAGFALFERITGLQEYYVMRSEVDILKRYGPAIGSLFPANCALVEFGAGSSRKARILFGMTPSITTYVPVDVSGEFLQNDVFKLRNDFPCLGVNAGAKLHHQAGARLRHGLPWTRHEWSLAARESGVLGGAERSSPEAA